MEGVGIPTQACQLGVTLRLNVVGWRKASKAGERRALRRGAMLT